MTEETEKPKIFLRRASGLIRAWSPYDMFLYEVIILSPIISIAYVISFASADFPAGSQVWACIILLIFTLCGAIPYVMLGASMPRTGGDYIWQSRILTPGHAFTFTLPWTWWFGGCAWVPYVGWLTSWLIWTPFLMVLGGVTGNTFWSDLGVWLGTVEGVVLMGIIISVFSFFVVAVGMKWYARIQKFFFYLGMAGWITWMGMTLLHTRADFIAGFNNVANNLLGVSGNVYQQILDIAVNQGFNPTPAFRLADTFYIVPLTAFVFVWVGWVTYVFGEVRKAEQIKQQVFMLMGGTVFAAFLAISIVASMMYGPVGREFYNSAIFAYYQGISPLPVFPMFAFFLSTLTANPLLMLWILFSVNGWVWCWVGTLTLQASRTMFAMSFDRVLPDWVAEIRTKYNIPLWNLLLILGTNIAFVLLFNYIPAFTEFFLNVVIWGMYVQLTTVIAAVLWPWLKKDSFTRSVARNYKTVMIVAGLAYIAFSIAILFLYIWPTTGAWYGTASIPSYLWLAGNIAAHYLLYRWYRFKRTREGIDFDLIYKEIPVE